MIFILLHRLKICQFQSDLEILNTKCMSRAKLAIFYLHQCAHLTDWRALSGVRPPLYLMLIQIPITINNY